MKKIAMKPASPDDPLLSVVRDTLRTERMVAEGDRVLVAVSGGPDSVCLLHVLWSLGQADGFVVSAGHLNHCLRGNESDDDEAFVSRLAADMCIRRRTGRFQVGAKDEAGSQEDRARQARYEFLKKSARSLKCDVIATGHTVDDQAETVLMRLLRGTGISGLAGIHPVRADGIIRPLIEVTRSEVMAYVKRHQLPFRTDSSNAGHDYFRNRIRHRLLPYIKRNFKADAHLRLAATAAVARIDEAWHEDAVTRCFTKALKLKGRYTIILDIQKVRAYNDSIINRIIRRSLYMLEGSASLRHIRSVLRAVSAKTLWLGDLPGGLTAETTKTELVFTVGSGNVFRRRYLPVPGRTVLPGGAGMLTVAAVTRKELRKDLKSYPSHIGILDRDVFTGRAAVRPRRNGDRFYPLGTGGVKRLKDFLSENGIPRSLRGRLPLVVDGRNIAWVAGMRPDERYKVTKRTQRVLMITYEEDGTRE